MHYLLFVLLLLSIGCSNRPVVSATMTHDSSKQGGRPAVDRKTYPQEEFKKLVVEKTQEEVLTELGDPNKKDELGGDPKWIYYDITIDPSTKTIDVETTLHFKDGVVDRVSFARANPPG